VLLDLKESIIDVFQDNVKRIAIVHLLLVEPSIHLLVSESESRNADGGLYVQLP